jgi:putative glutamine amidotransferase
MTKPVIGVVLALTSEDHDFHPLPAYRFEFLKQHYYESVEAAGGVTIAIPLTERLQHIEYYCNLVDGFLFVGGEDVHPDLYGESVDPLCKPQMPRRDNFEAALMRAAVGAGKPLMGICRGSQIMNVAFGGSLYQDISYQKGAANHSQVGELDFTTRHLVHIAPQSLLHQLTGKTELETNTAHHQAIKRLGEGLKATATTNDGVVEAIEGPNFTLGIQWHPEAWGQDESSRRIFVGFCQAALRARSR